jgi:hypothetical protein
MNHLTLIEDVVAAVKFQGFNATLIKGTTTSSLFMIDRANQLQTLLVVDPYNLGRPLSLHVGPRVFFHEGPLDKINNSSLVRALTALFQENMETIKMMEAQVEEAHGVFAKMGDKHLPFLSFDGMLIERVYPEGYNPKGATSFRFGMDRDGEYTLSVSSLRIFNSDAIEDMANLIGKNGSVNPSFIPARGGFNDNFDFMLDVNIKADYADVYKLLHMIMFDNEVTLKFNEGKTNPPTTRSLQSALAMRDIFYSSKEKPNLRPTAFIILSRHESINRIYRGE